MKDMRSRVRAYGREASVPSAVDARPARAESRRRFLGRAVGAVVAGTVLGQGAVWADSPGRLPLSDLAVVTERGRFSFLVEVADTPETRAQGLMYRRSLADDAGMLFDFGRPIGVSMWMKDTFVSLDMIFIDDRGRVIAVAAHTEPQSLTPIRAERPARAVLEVVAGTAERIGLRPGDQVDHSIFSRTSR